MSEENFIYNKIKEHIEQLNHIQPSNDNCNAFEFLSACT